MACLHERKCKRGANLGESWTIGFHGYPWPNGRKDRRTAFFEAHFCFFSAFIIVDARPISFEIGPSFIMLATTMALVMTEDDCYVYFIWLFMISWSFASLLLPFINFSLGPVARHGAATVGGWWQFSFGKAEEKGEPGFLETQNVGINCRRGNVVRLSHPCSRLSIFSGKLCPYGHTAAVLFRAELSP